MTLHPKDDPRYKKCGTDGCDTYVKPAAGHLGGPVKCLDCMEKQVEENTIP